MKEKFYFSHDYDAQGDPKIVAMKSQFGVAGYGLYWSLIEFLHCTEAHKLPTKQWQYVAIAKQNDLEVEYIKKFIEDCVTEYELFNTDGNHFWSDRVLRNFEKRDEISKKRAESGKRGASVKQLDSFAKQNLASAEQISANADKGKEIKGKEIKEEKTSTIVDEKSEVDGDGDYVLPDDLKKTQRDLLASLNPNKATKITLDEAERVMKESKELEESVCMKHHIDRNQFENAIETFVRDKKAEDYEVESPKDVKRHFRNWVPSWISNFGHNPPKESVLDKSRDGPGRQDYADLPPEIKLERDRRKTQYESRIAGFPHFAGQRSEYGIQLSKYHLKIGYYDELRPENIQNL